MKIANKMLCDIRLEAKGEFNRYYLKDIREHVVPYTNISLAFVLVKSSAVVVKSNKYCDDGYTSRRQNLEMNQVRKKVQPRCWQYLLGEIQS